MTFGNEDLVYSSKDGEDDDSGSEFKEGHVDNVTVIAGSGFNLAKRNDDDDDDDCILEDDNESGIEVTTLLPFVNWNGTHHFASSIYLLYHSRSDMLRRATGRKLKREMGSHDIG
jgi:hypothetical protein